MQPTLQDSAAWERLAASRHFKLERRGRHLKATLLAPHLVLSTSSKNGGQQSGLQYLVNHQSCEGKHHQERHELIKQLGLDGYHDLVCQEIGVDPSVAAVMGTAANMNYVAVESQSDGDLTATAVVTAGVHGNAACAGDPAGWRETDGVWEKVNPLSGTINTMLLINHPLTEGALARAAMTMTEAKSAALTRLAIGSLYSSDSATGTGTDQFCIAAACTDAKPLTSTSPHVKLGELIGVAVRDATLEALRWQNGLEPSYTRSVFHALGRFGLKEATVYADMAPWLDERTLEFLRLNSKSVFYEPLASAAAYAIATILDRARNNTIPASVAREALRQQAACLAVAMAAQAHKWNEFRATLPEPDPEQPIPIVLAAIARGWIARWT